MMAVQGSSASAFTLARSTLAHRHRAEGGLYTSSKLVWEGEDGEEVRRALVDSAGRN